MDFIDIVLEGYFTPNNRDHLAKYFIRQFKEAEKSNYDSEVFFDGCLKVIDAFIDHSKGRWHERQRELYFMLNEAQNKTLIYADSETDMNYEEHCKETIAYCENELNNTTFENYHVNLAVITNGKYAYNLSFSVVYFIRDAILEAIEKIRPTDLKTGLLAFAPIPPQLVMNPIFKPDAIETIYDILKDHFSLEQQPRLKELLNTGKETSEHLIFLGNQNRLADAFKQLIEKDFITGCQKKELESWIFNNFQCLQQHTRQPVYYTLRYLEDIISGNKAPCKKQLFKIELDKVTGKQMIRKA